MELTIYERDNSIAHEKVESIDRICIFLVSVVIFCLTSFIDVIIIIIMIIYSDNSGNSLALYNKIIIE